MNKILSKIWSKISQKNITDSRVMAEISETREMATSSSRDIGESRLADYCPYCNSRTFVKRGTRKKKLEVVQLYLCRDCKRTFTAQFVKGKHYPTKLVIDAISIYNLGFGLEETCRLVNERYGLKVSAAQREGNVGSGLRPSTLADWYKEY